MITIIYSHPDPKSYNHSILNAVKHVLKKTEKEYEVINLYKEKYNPVLKIEELYTRKPFNVSKQTKKYQNLITKADKLIFIYPTWWNGMPAILKGFLDKTFISGFAFRYKKIIANFSAPAGLLGRKKALIITTTGGPSWISLLTRNRNTKTLKNDILNLCGIKASIIHVSNVKQGNKKLNDHLRKIKLAVLNFVRS